MKEQAEFFSLGINALTVDFGNRISEHINARVISLAGFFERQKFSGIEDVFPAYSSLTLFFNPIRIKENHPDVSTAFEAVKLLAQKGLNEIACELPAANKIKEIPVNFDDKCAPDLAFVATHNHLTVETVIEIFTEKIYRVFMLGFLPGFAYLGELDERIAAPRKDSPRQTVSAGSVGIAGRQTGIYPFESPGGWQIIGKTDTALFAHQNSSPSFFRAGDFVKFVRNLES